MENGLIRPPVPLQFFATVAEAVASRSGAGSHQAFIRRQRCIQPVPSPHMRALKARVAQERRAPGLCPGGDFVHASDSMTMTDSSLIFSQVKRAYECSRMAFGPIEFSLPEGVRCAADGNASGTIRIACSMGDVSTTVFRREAGEGRRLEVLARRSFRRSQYACRLADGERTMAQLVPSGFGYDVRAFGEGADEINAIARSFASAVDRSFDIFVSTGTFSSMPAADVTRAEYDPSTMGLDALRDGAASGWNFAASMAIFFVSLYLFIGAAGFGAAAAGAIQQTAPRRDLSAAV